MKKSTLKITLIALVLLSILADILLIDISIEQIPRSFDAFVSFLKPTYWNSILPYFYISNLLIHSFNIFLVLFAIIGVYKYMRYDKSNRLLLIYLNYKIAFSLITTFVWLKYFPQGMNSLNLTSEIGAYINTTIPFLFLILFYPSNYLKTIIRPNYEQDFRKIPNLSRFLNVIIDSFIVMVFFISLPSVLHGLSLNLIIDLSVVFSAYAFVCIIYFQNSISTIATKKKSYNIFKKNR